MGKTDFTARMAGWAAYSDMCMNGNASGAAIVGKQGGIWGQSGTFPANMSVDEATKIVAGFGSMSMPSGIYIGGKKYMFLRCDGEMMMGKAGAEGCSIAITTQAIVVSIYGEGMQGGANSVACGAAADALKGQGY